MIPAVRPGDACTGVHHYFVVDRVLTRDPLALYVVVVCTACGADKLLRYPLEGEEALLGAPDVKEF